MEVNALLIDDKDNVVTCIREVERGMQVCYRNQEQTHGIRAEEDIPFCHKVAITAIKKGGRIIKYGETIGIASKEIPKGTWVAHHNIYSIPRDYASEMMEE